MHQTRLADSSDREAKDTDLQYAVEAFHVAWQEGNAKRLHELWAPIARVCTSIEELNKSFEMEKVVGWQVESITWEDDSDGVELTAPCGGDAIRVGRAAEVDVLLRVGKSEGGVSERRLVELWGELDGRYYFFGADEG